MTTDGMCEIPNKADLLTDDPAIPGQAWALVSVVAPTGTSQKAEQMAVKLRGVFSSREAAKDHVKKLHEEHGETTFDIFMMELFKWVSFPPKISDETECQYQEEMLQTLIGDYHKNQRQAKELFMRRKDALVAGDSLDDHLTPEERVPPPPIVEVGDDDGAGPSSG